MSSPQIWQLDEKEPRQEWFICLISASIFCCNNVLINYIWCLGLAREYILRADGKAEMRRPRENTLFRGTTKYCSANTHSRSEQGRPDDLWSMVYMLAEMRGPLPWDALRWVHLLKELYLNNEVAFLVKSMKLAPRRTKQVMRSCCVNASLRC